MRTDTGGTDGPPLLGSALYASLRACSRYAPYARAAVSGLRPPVAREGWPLVGAALSLVPFVAPLGPVPVAGALAAATIVALFFRDPERPAPTRNDLLYAPADGRVLHTARVNAETHAGVSCWHIAIFLSLFDVHINRSPAAGVVMQVEHRSGRKRAAWEPDVAAVNERNTLLLQTAVGPVAVVQIAGMAARRIVCYPAVGARVASGERIGLIRFGSRTDIIFPASTARPLVGAGERVRAGITPVAAFHAEAD